MIDFSSWVLKNLEKVRRSLSSGACGKTPTCSLTVEGEVAWSPPPPPAAPPLQLQICIMSSSFQKGGEGVRRELGELHMLRRHIHQRTGRRGKQTQPHTPPPAWWPDLLKLNRESQSRPYFRRNWTLENMGFAAVLAGKQILVQLLRINSSNNLIVFKSSSQLQT